MNHFKPQVQCVTSILHPDSCKKCDKCINQAKVFVREYGKIPIVCLSNEKIYLLVRGYAVLQDSWGLRKLQKWIDGLDPKGREVNSEYSYWGHDE